MQPKNNNANDEKIEPYYHKLNLNTDFPTFKKIVDDNNLNFNDLPSLQTEVEKILSQFGHTITKISNVISGKRFRGNKTKQKVANNIPTSLPNGDSNNSDTNQDSVKELIVKDTPDKPLTLIISQTRSDKKRTRSSLRYDEVNSMTSSDNNSVSKRRKSNDSNMDQPQLIEEFNGIKSLGKIVPDTNAQQSNNNKFSSNYEMPNKFWELMEPYCAEINEKNIKKLESMIESYNDDGHFYEIPNDRQTSGNSSLNGFNGLSTNNNNETSNSSRRNLINNEFDDNVKKHLNGFVDTKNGIDLTNLLKKIDTELRRPLSQQKSLQKFPSKIVQNLTQVSGMPNMQTKNDNEIDTRDPTIAKEHLTQSSKSIAKQLHVNNGFKLERHIKKSLDDLGLTSLEPQAQPTNKQSNKLDESSLIKSQASDPINGGITKSLEADIKDPIIINNTNYVELSLPAIPVNPVNNLTNNVSLDGSLTEKTYDSVNSDKKQSQELCDKISSTKKKSQKPQPHKKIDLSARCDDQIVNCALERRQAELRLVSESNLGMLRRLLGVAKRDLKRQEIERRLAIADADVIEAYNVIESYRPTHRQPLKKDRDAASKALRERQKILKELELFDSEFL